MIKPERPVSGKPIPKGWHTALWDWVKSMDISGDQKTIFVKSTDQGKTISSKPFSDVQNANPSGGVAPYTLFEVVKDTDTSIKILGYNSEENRWYNNYCVFGLDRVEIADGATVSNIDSTGVIYLKATYSDGEGGEGGQGEEGWTVTPEFSAGLPENDAGYNIRYLADVIFADGKISGINQPPTGIIYFPPYLESYQTNKKMVLIVDNGIYKWIEIGNCNGQ